MRQPTGGFWLSKARKPSTTPVSRGPAGVDWHCFQRFTGMSARAGALATEDRRSCLSLNLDSPLIARGNR